MAGIDLSDEIKEHVNGALAAGNPMVMASVDDEGRPRLSFRGSVAVFSADQLGVWARNAEGQTANAIGSNPHVAFMYRSPAQRVILQFAGRARMADASERDQVYANAPEFEQRADPDKKGAGIIVDLDKVEGLLGIDPDGTRRLVRMVRE
jgi:pyridoxine/pyridoxamine 5'-phosphate oxidase